MVGHQGGVVLVGSTSRVGSIVARVQKTCELTDNISIVSLRVRGRERRGGEGE